MSSDLVWQCIKKHNAFMVSRNGRTSRTGAVRLSTEAGNVANVHSFKFSGVANAKAVDVSLSGSDVSMGIKGKNGKFAKTPLNKCFRRSTKSIQGAATKNHYRSDLKQAALARYSRCKHVSNVKKSVRKASAVHRCRTTKTE